MDHKKSPTSRRTKRQSKALEENYWDCSVCTYRNTAEAFKCLMCDIRKGTSTRKPRINPQLVAQQVAQQFNPTPAKTNKKEKSDKKSSHDRRSNKKRHHLRKLRNVDRNSAETREVTVNNVTVMITEYKPKPAKKLVSDQSGQSSRASSESESSSEAPSAAADSDSRSSLLKLKVFMERKAKRNAESQWIEKKLMRTTNRIKKARRNKDLAKKEAAEFEEIHKILESKENDLVPNSDSKPLFDLIDAAFLELSAIPLTLPTVKVFKDESVFSLFDKDSLQLKNFVFSEEEFPKFFGKNDSIPSEDCFRNLIAYRVAENLMSDEEISPSVTLYVLYLMSVHDKPVFVAACFDFLVHRPCRLESKHILPILINFGVNLDDYPCDTALIQKLSGKDGDFRREGSEKKAFPHYNMAMVGKILVHYVTGNYIGVDSETKILVKALARVTLDPKVRSGSLLPIYSILVSSFSARIVSDFGLSEVVDMLHFPDEHLMSQLRICRTVSSAVCPSLHCALILKTIHTILNSKSLPNKPTPMIQCIKSILRKLKSGDLSPFKFYCVIQLINTSLPGVTATKEDSVEINNLLTFLEVKIIKTEDSVDLVRLKLELAKARNLVANNVNNRFTLEETSITSHSRKS